MSAVYELPVMYNTMSNVVAIPKSDDRKTLSSYRPISLLPLTSKLLKKHIYYMNTTQSFILSPKINGNFNRKSLQPLQWRMQELRKGGSCTRKRHITRHTLGGSGGMPPRNFLKNSCSEVCFSEFLALLLTCF